MIDAPKQAGRYRCLVVDPPWNQGKMGKLKARPNKTDSLDYKTMSFEDMLGLPIGEWGADNSYLWLWATASKELGSRRPIIRLAFDLMENWGYTYYTFLTWDKGCGPCTFSPYQVVTEHCLFGYRGKVDFSKESWGQMKTLFSSPARSHSTKPNKFYGFLNRYFPGPRLDVFARSRRHGFDGWGDQYDGSSEPCLLD